MAAFGIAHSLSGSLNQLFGDLLRSTTDGAYGAGRVRFHGLLEDRQLTASTGLPGGSLHVRQGSPQPADAEA